MCSALPRHWSQQFCRDQQGCCTRHTHPEQAVGREVNSHKRPAVYPRCRGRCRGKPSWRSGWTHTPIFPPAPISHHQHRLNIASSPCTLLSFQSGLATPSSIRDDLVGVLPSSPQGILTVNVSYTSSSTVQTTSQARQRQRSITPPACSSNPI